VTYLKYLSWYLAKGIYNSPPPLKKFGWNILPPRAYTSRHLPYKKFAYVITKEQTPYYLVLLTGTPTNQLTD
jgi:hypothetical protein